jgi:hypothetical protein
MSSNPLNQALNDLQIEPQLRERVRALAEAWAAPYWEGFLWPQVNDDPQRFCLRPLVLAAALRHGSAAGRERWQRFLRHVAEELRDETRNPVVRFLSSPEALIERLAALLVPQASNLLQEDALLDPAWLWRLYRTAYRSFGKDPPDALPAWWRDVVGGAPLAPPPYVPPPDSPAPFRIPNEAEEREFVRRECRGQMPLARRLFMLRRKMAPIQHGATRVRLTQLQFLILRYCCDVGGNPTPTSAELAEILNAAGYVTSRRGQIKANNIDKIFSRVCGAAPFVRPDDYLGGNLFP